MPTGCVTHNMRLSFTVFKQMVVVTDLGNKEEELILVVYFIPSAMTANFSTFSTSRRAQDPLRKKVGGRAPLLFRASGNGTTTT